MYKDSKKSINDGFDNHLKKSLEHKDLGELTGAGVHQIYELGKEYIRSHPLGKSSKVLRASLLLCFNKSSR